MLVIFFPGIFLGPSHSTGQANWVAFPAPAIALAVCVCAIHSDFPWEKRGQFLGTLTLLLCQRATLSMASPPSIKSTHSFSLDEISNCCSLTSFWLHLVFSFISPCYFRVFGCANPCKLHSAFSLVLQLLENKLLFSTTFEGTSYSSYWIPIAFII